MNSQILAKIVGLSLFLFSFILLYNKKALQISLRLLKSKEFIFLSGLSFIFFGIIIISIHNVWELNWKGLLTLVGWISILEGLFRTFFIDLTLKTSKNIKSLGLIKTSLIISMALGFYLIFVSFLK